MIELIIIAIVVFFVWSSISDAKRVRKVQKSAENCKAKHEIVAILKSVSAARVDNATCAFLSIVPVIRAFRKSFKWI